MRVWISTAVTIPELQTLHLIPKKNSVPSQNLSWPTEDLQQITAPDLRKSFPPTWPWIQATPIETHHFSPFPTPETRAPARPSTSHSGEWSWNLTGSSFRPPSCANFNPAYFFSSRHKWSQMQSILQHPKTLWIIDGLPTSLLPTLSCQQLFHLSYRSTPCGMHANILPI